MAEKGERAAGGADPHSPLLHYPTHMSNLLYSQNSFHSQISFLVHVRHTSFDITDTFFLYFFTFFFNIKFLFDICSILISVWMFMIREGR